MGPGAADLSVAIEARQAGSVLRILPTSGMIRRQEERGGESAEQWRMQVMVRKGVDEAAIDGLRGYIEDCQTVVGSQDFEPTATEKLVAGLEVSPSSDTVDRDTLKFDIIDTNSPSLPATVELARAA